MRSFDRCHNSFFHTVSFVSAVFLAPVKVSLFMCAWQVLVFMAGNCNSGACVRFADCRFRQAVGFHFRR